MSTAERALVAWIPDWPIHAYLQDQTDAEGADTVAEPVAATTPSAPAIALIAGHRVIACSAAARAEGVRIGLREREAQMRCPDLILRPHIPEVDERRFAPVIAAIEQLIPGVESRRPGVCAMRARGPARFYGGEEPAAAALLELARTLGLPELRVGIADGLFTAEQAARTTREPLRRPTPQDSGCRSWPRAAPQRSVEPVLPVGRAAPGDFAEVLQGSAS